MQDLAVVDMLEAEADLGEPVEDLGLGEVAASLFFYFLGQIASIGIVHHNAEMAFLGFVGLAEPDDVGMIEYLQNLRLLQSLLAFLFTHLLDDYLFDHSERLVTLALDEECLSESTLTEQLDLVVYLELGSGLCARLFCHILNIYS